jgi:hypothetical protein
MLAIGSDALDGLLSQDVGLDFDAAYGELFLPALAHRAFRRPGRPLHLTDWHPSPAAAQLGRFGALHVGYGKAMLGGPPRRRTVPSVYPWAVKVAQQYQKSVRPLLCDATDPAMWPSERGSRPPARALNDRMAAYRQAIGLPKELDLHALRHLASAS